MLPQLLIPQFLLLLTLGLGIARLRCGLTGDRILAVLLAAFGLIGYALWVGGQGAPQYWSGLPLSVSLTSAQIANTSWTFETAAAAVMVGGAIAGALRKQSVSEIKHLTAQTLVHKVKLRHLLFVHALVLAVWITGQGTSVLYREQYQATTGSSVMLKIATTVLLPTLVGTTFVLANAAQRQVRPIVALMIGWVVLEFSVATRGALLVLISTLGALAYRQARQARVLSTFAIVLLGLVAASIIADPLHVARSQPHGITQVSSMAFSGTQNVSIASSVQGMFASLGSAFPATALTAERPIPPTILGQIVNPLPRAELGNADQHLKSYETLWPWRVVPTTAIGEIRSAGGLWLVAASFFGLAFLLRKWHDALTSQISRQIVSGYSLLLFVVCIQYPLRQFVRVGDVILIGTVIIAISKFKNGSQYEYYPAGRPLSLRESDH